MIRKDKATPTAIGTRKVKSESRKHSSAGMERDREQGEQWLQVRKYRGLIKQKRIQTQHRAETGRGKAKSSKYEAWNSDGASGPCSHWSEKAKSFPLAMGENISGKFFFEEKSSISIYRELLVSLATSKRLVIITVIDFIYQIEKVEVKAKARNIW